MNDITKNIENELKNMSWHIIDLFKRQVSSLRAADLVLCKLLYEWLYSTEKIYKWKLPSKVSSTNTASGFYELFIRDTQIIENQNKILKNIFTYLSVNDLKKIKLLEKHYIYADAFRYMDFTTQESKIALKNFFNKFIEEIDSINGRHDENVTPKCIRKLLVRLLSPKDNTTIADINLGTGAILEEVKEFIQCNNKDISKIKFYGEDINPRMVALASIRLLFNEVDNFQVKMGDIMNDPYCNEYKKLIKYDYIISDYPLNLVGWSINLNDIHDRFLCETTKIRYADWVFNQHIIKALNHNGKAAVVVSKGSLIRNQETFIRKNMVEQDLIETIILLPSGLYYGQAIPIAIIVFNKCKLSTRSGKVQFIDASSCFKKIEKNKCAMTNKQIEKIVNAYLNDKNINSFSIFINKSEIENKKYNLNSAEYLEGYLLKDKIKKTVFLDKVAQVKKGVNVSKEDIEKLKDWTTHYYITISNIEDGKINYESADKIGVKDEWVTKARILPGDIIVSARGYSIKIAMVENYISDSIVSDNLLIIRVDPDKYDAKILKKYLDSSLGRKFLDGVQTGSATIKLITKKNLEKLLIPCIEEPNIKRLAELIDYSEKKYHDAIKHAKEVYDQETNEIYMKMGIE